MKFEESEEMRKLFSTLQELKNKPLEPSDPNYFSTLLSRTRSRIEAEKKTPVYLIKPKWQRLVKSLQTQLPALMLIAAAIVLVLIFTISSIDDLSLFKQKNIYSSAAKELNRSDIDDLYPGQQDLFMDEVEQLNDQQFQHIMEGLSS